MEIWFFIIRMYPLCLFVESLVRLKVTLDELHACGGELYLNQQATDITRGATRAVF